MEGMSNRWNKAWGNGVSLDGALKLCSKDSHKDAELKLMRDTMSFAVERALKTIKTCGTGQEHVIQCTIGGAEDGRIRLGDKNGPELTDSQKSLFKTLFPILVRSLIQFCDSGYHGSLPIKGKFWLTTQQDLDNSSQINVVLVNKKSKGEQEVLLILQRNVREPSVNHFSDQNGFLLNDGISLSTQVSINKARIENQLVRQPVIQFPPEEDKPIPIMQPNQNPIPFNHPPDQHVRRANFYAVGK